MILKKGAKLDNLFKQVSADRLMYHYAMEQVRGSFSSKPLNEKPLIFTR